MVFGLLWLIEPQSTTQPLRREAAPEAREARLAKNEIVFRSVNERIQEMAVNFGGDDYEFVCECSARDCLERIQLTRREYEHIRAEGTRFFVKPGHEDVLVELVVERRPSYFVVEKDGTAGVVAELADPRDGDPS